MKLCCKCNIREVMISYRVYCKECKNKLDKEYRLKNIDKIKKSWKEVTYPKYRQKYLEYQKKYVAENKDKVSNYKKEYYEKNKEELKKYRQEYYKRNKEKILKRCSDYALENKERTKIRKKKWVQNNREKVNNCNRRRRDRKLLLDGDYSLEDQRYTREIFKDKCFNCDSTKKLCVDHHNPLIKGFGLSRTNAVLLCSHCNNCKYTKHPEIFYSKEKLQELTNLGIITCYDNAVL